jgi:hypothetical protein
MNRLNQTEPATFPVFFRIGSFFFILNLFMEAVVTASYLASKPTSPCVSGTEHLNGYNYYRII